MALPLGSDKIHRALDSLWLHYPSFAIRTSDLDKVFFHIPARRTVVTDFETCLRNFSTCFRIFFVASSVEYAALGAGWFWARSLCLGCRPLLIRGCLASFTIAAFAIGALLVGSRLERLQSRLLEVGGSTFHTESAAKLIQMFVLSVTVSISLAQPFTQLAKMAIALFRPSDHMAGSNDKAPMKALSPIPGTAPPSRMGQPDRHEWETATIKKPAEVVPGGRPLLHSSETPTMPTPATTSSDLESHERINVDSRECIIDAMLLDQLRLEVKEEQLAKKRKQIDAGRWIQRGMRARCCRCRRPVTFSNEECPEVGFEQLRCSCL